MNNKPFTEKEFKEIYSKVPRLCVDVILLTKDGIVLTKRKQTSYNGKWHIPGGTVLYQESLKEAVERIGRIEFGVRIEIRYWLSYVEYLDEVKEKGYGHSIGLAFLVTTKDKIPMVNRDGEQIKVFNKIPRNFVKAQRKLMNEALDLYESLKV